MRKRLPILTLALVSIEIRSDLPLSLLYLILFPDIIKNGIGLGNFFQEFCLLCFFMRYPIRLRRSPMVWRVGSEECEYPF
ncbi:MAG: hypothetical protein O4861_07195 [Trichodesmium sp. St16_bin4-tuft]|nr:hypothetical protein [Trichodesmium sp. MAG_R01]MDE5068684.1 hypothetical protein [Trichodesmium sp. St4_bin8_1]MDE5091150.1 hypothetical protein [Trichodesmium sp. St18_bin3_1_1]MDE5098131.1 hypothetical protein [Trichodesmium sp. St16_bin4-tuft]MDE5102030.1 hypothetical protein [Trichodesmium sp. St19_bin2]